MSDYYSDNLSAQRLEKCYDLATPRIRQYLEAEIDFVRQYLSDDGHAIELGCGYGRVLKQLYRNNVDLTGIDISRENLDYARKYLNGLDNIALFRMNAIEIGFGNDCFDLLICIQNGMSAFHEDPATLINKSIRIVKPGGKLLFSSYSDKIWDERLEWFKIKSNHGLLGELDMERSRNGTIVCKDGFSATTFDRTDFENLTRLLSDHVEIIEVDSSSIFCIITKKSD